VALAGMEGMAVKLRRVAGRVRAGQPGWAYL
jgi:hypothetical protein